MGGGGGGGSAERCVNMLLFNARSSQVQLEMELWSAIRTLDSGRALELIASGGADLEATHDVGSAPATVRSGGVENCMN